MKQICYLLLLCLLPVGGATAQEEVNYDESKVPAYVLPELLVCADGERVTTVQGWEQKRRPELLELFSAQMYGRTPQEPIDVTYETLTENPGAMNGRATSKQVLLRFSGNGRTVEAILWMYIPNGVEGRVPVFVGYNFHGNHSTTLDTTVRRPPLFHLLKEPGHPHWERGCQMSRWSYEQIIERGYAVATMCYHDIFPDKPGFGEYSIAALFAGYDPAAATPSDGWQAIGAWAWGSSRIVDYLETQKRIDAGRIILMGHSRQGKAALWAGAQDPRFRVVISNNSGSGGAALSKRVFGEAVAQVSAIQPAWFCPAFDRYRNREADLPFDQHQLIALMAPRKVYVASAEEDLWADPRGEYLAAFHAGEVYALYGLEGLASERMPALNCPEMKDVGYHIRTGKHDVTEYDWQRYMDFADKHLR